MEFYINILADRDDSGGWSSIIFVLVFIAISVFSHLAKKAKEKEVQQKLEAELVQTKGQHGATGQTKADPRATPLPVQQPRRQHPAAQLIQPKPITLAVTLDQQRSAANATRVQNEIRQQELRQAKLAKQQAQRLAARKSPEENVTVGRLQQSDDSQKVSKRNPLFIAASLRNNRAARKAIIMHEIFSPAKALRQDQEMWDM